VNFFFKFTFSLSQARTPQQFIFSLCSSLCVCVSRAQLVNFLPVWVQCEFHPWARAEESVCLHSFKVQHSTHHHFFSKTVLRAERDRRAERSSIKLWLKENSYFPLDSFDSASIYSFVRLVALGIIACFMVSQHFNLKIHGAV